MTKLEKYWDKLKAIVSANPKGKALDANGQFYPDPTPVAPPLGIAPDIDMFERMREMVRREMSAAAAAGGFESFEEADDFEVFEEDEPFSPYEMILEQARPDGPVLNPDPGQPLGQPLTKAEEAASVSAAPAQVDQGKPVDKGKS